MTNHPNRSRQCFYATTDSEDICISRDAHIEKFTTRADAEAFLRGSYDAADLATDGLRVEIVAGDFSDCWIKLHGAPRPGDSAISPFSYTQTVVQRPGTHPGGREYWITPTPDVLVATIVPLSA